ncbi:MAG: hypothetical protein AAFR62_18805 [Cyanobacteria bacterium J06629_2]
MAHFDALSCIDGDLSLSGELNREIHCVSKWLTLLEPKVDEHWLIRLETLIASLALEIRITVAKNLQLPKDSLQRFQQLETLETQVITALDQTSSPSQIYQLLSNFKSLSLIIFAARNNKYRRLVWQYLTVFSQAKPLLNGSDLKTLGFKPGPLYKQILDDVFAATLDNQISAHTQAIEYVKSKYQV